MALKVKICTSISDDCKTIYFFDKTGAYDASTNTTGYGSPNPLTTDFTTATLTITLGGATVSLTPISIIASFPTSNTALAWQVTAASLGMTSFPIGLTRVTYNISGRSGGVAVAYSATTLFLCDCSIECCLENKLIDIIKNPPCGCDCEEDERIINALYIEALLQGACAGTECGDTTSVNTTITTLQTKCNGTSSGGCGCS